MGFGLGDITKGISNFGKAVGEGISKTFGDIADGVHKTYNDVMKTFGKISNTLGPVGTLALIVAMPYIASWASASFAAAAPGATGTQIMALEAVGSAGAASAAAGASTSAALTQGAMLAEQTAIFGAAGAEATATALGYSSASAAAAAGSTVMAEYASAAAAMSEAAAIASNSEYGLDNFLTDDSASESFFNDPNKYKLTAEDTYGKLNAELAPYEYTPGEVPTLEFQQAGTTTPTGAMADPDLGISAQDLYSSEALGETTASTNWWDKAKKAASLLGGGQELPAYSVPPSPEIPALSKASAQPITAAGTGAGVGLTKYAEQANPDYVLGVKRASERWKKSLLG